MRIVHNTGKLRMNEIINYDKSVKPAKTDAYFTQNRHVKSQ